MSYWWYLQTPKYILINMQPDVEEFMVKLFQYIAAAPAVVQTVRFMSVSSWFCFCSKNYSSSLNLFIPDVLLEPLMRNVFEKLEHPLKI